MNWYFTRHGESEANLLHEFSNRGMKHPLTARGRDQAQGLAASLVGVPLLRVYSSPVLRALETTALVCQRLGLSSFVVDEALREYDVGVFEGRSDPEAWALFAQVEESWTRLENAHRSLEGGESFTQIQARFRRFFERVEAELGSQDGTVLVVAHGGVLKVGLPGVTPDWTYAGLRERGWGHCEILRIGEPHGR